MALVESNAAFRQRCNEIDQSGAFVDALAVQNISSFVGWRLHGNALETAYRPTVHYSGTGSVWSKRYPGPDVYDQAPSF